VRDWRIQAYVLSRFLTGIGAALAAIASVIVLIDFVEVSRTLGGGRLELSFAQLFYLTLLKSPAVILQLLPFVFLFGTMGAYVALNRRSELVAMRAAGVSAWRFILPSAVAALAIGVLTTTVLNPAASSLNARYEDRQAELTEGAQGGPDEIWLRQGDDRQQVVIHAKRHDTVNDVVRLRGVSVFIQTVDPTGDLNFSRRLEATEGDLMPGYWRLTDVREALPGSGTAHSDGISIPSMLDHRTAMEKFVSPSAVAFWRRLSPAPAAAAGRAAALRRHGGAGRRVLAAPHAAGRPGGPGRSGRGAWLRILFCRRILRRARSRRGDPIGPRRLGAADPRPFGGRHAPLLYGGRLTSALGKVGTGFAIQARSRYPTADHDRRLGRFRPNAPRPSGYRRRPVREGTASGEILGTGGRLREQPAGGRLRVRRTVAFQDHHPAGQARAACC
jgi:lipopolysaccharide export system permease protein